MKLSALPFSVAALTLAFLEAKSTMAFSVPIVGRPRRSLFPDPLQRRADMNSSHNGSTLVTNSWDTVYNCNITLGGTQFEVLIDTGSSDLWVAGDVPGAKNLDIPAKITYAKGEAKGFINTADLVFDEFTVKDQGFIKANASEDNPVDHGVLGLGPSSNSNVRRLAKGPAGDTPLDRIFKQNLTTPNYLTVLLSRLADDPAGPDALAQVGQLTIGRVIPGLENITSQPRLPALDDSFGIQHWQTMLDPNGIIGPDGQPIDTRTSVKGTKNRNQLHVIFDTGFTFPQVTRTVADAIYGRVPGAEFVPQTDSPGYWRIPCDYELQIAFMFHGVSIPIAPLDMTMVESTSRVGRPLTCMATFREIHPEVADHTKFGAFDMILGMAFLRNAYLLIDFGDFVNGADKSKDDPYIQLLPITNTTDAHLDFVAVRQDGLDRADQQEPLLPPGQGQKSPTRARDDDDFSTNARSGGAGDTPFYRSVWFIVAVSVGGVLVLATLGLLLAYVLRRRRSAVPREKAFVPAMRGVSAYRPLGHPDQERGQEPPRPESPVWQYENRPLPEPGTSGAGYAGRDYDYDYDRNGHSTTYQEPRYQYEHA